MNIYTLKKLIEQIGSKRKIQFLFLLLFTIVSALLEVLSIYSIVPFIGLVTNEDYVGNVPYIKEFILIDDRNKAVMVYGLIFGFLYILNAFSRILLIYCSARLSKMTTAELSINMYKYKIYESYSNYIVEKSANIISAITQKVYAVGHVINAIINIISGGIILLCIIAILIVINPKVMTISILFFATLFILISLLTKKKIKESSKIVNSSQNNVVKGLQNAIGAIRNIILDKTQNFYTKLFKVESFNLARQNAFIQFIQQSPRYIFEATGIFLFVILLIYWNAAKSKEEFLIIFPTLAALAIGAQRILPLLNAVYSNIVTIKGSFYQVAEVTDILSNYSLSKKENIKIKKKDINFKNLISFKNVSFSYDKRSNILQDVNFEIKKGSKIGVIGKTGEGKSTFLDLLMGLLEPQKGAIYIDSCKLSKETCDSWHSKVSHVPQKIFLSDDSFLENIAFGKEKETINKKKVELVSKQSQIHELIIKSEDGYNKKVGEQGISLSGGQIQRIGLARALYKEAELLILDEATNSLDGYTEKLIMEEINNSSKGLTVVIVSHNLNTLKDCDVIFEVKNKKVIQIPN
jgi:ABC-type multidrug transport system fused ATPase/permease subunit